MLLQRRTSRRCQQKFIDAVANKSQSQKSLLETFVVMRRLRLGWVFNRRNSGKTLWSPEKPANYAEVYQPLVFPACSPRKINHRQRLLTKTLEGGKSDLPSSFWRVLLRDDRKRRTFPPGSVFEECHHSRRRRAGTNQFYREKRDFEPGRWNAVQVD